MLEVIYSIISICVVILAIMDPDGVDNNPNPRIGVAMYVCLILFGVISLGFMVFRILIGLHKAYT